MELYVCYKTDYNSWNQFMTQHSEPYYTIKMVIHSYIYVKHSGVLILQKLHSIYSMCILPGQVFIILSVVVFFVQSEKN